MKLSKTKSLVLLTWLLLALSGALAATLRSSRQQRQIAGLKDLVCVNGAARLSASKEKVNMLLRLWVRSCGLLVLPVILFLSAVVPAQTTGFTYQGKLTDGGNPANGNYDLQFALWDSAGTQIGATQTVSGVSVSNGIFTVTLDFGGGAFNGANRFLEIGARPAGGSAFTILSPRQQITSTPYAIRSLNASSADTVPANGVSAGSGNYIQNSTSQQASSNFSISGNGTAGGTLNGSVVNATTQYNLGGFSVISGLPNNFFVGWSTGKSNTTGSLNHFFGFGTGQQNTTGSNNSFFGNAAGDQNTEGNDNAFFGLSSGLDNTTGFQNEFFGSQSGRGNGTGSNNTAIGYITYFGSGNLTNSTVIGANARVDQSNTMVLGSIAGINSATSSVNVGIGTTTPSAVLSVVKGGAPEPAVSGLATAMKVASPSGSIPLALKQNADENATPTLAWFETANGGQGFLSAAPSTFVVGAAATKQLAFNVGGTSAMTISTSGNVSLSNGLDVGTFATIHGTFAINTLGSGGNVQLCLNAQSIASTCSSSSLRYKKDLRRFSGGLNILNRLKPITFTWKDRPERDLGLAAEDVAAVEPLLTFRNNKGEIEGVKYDKLTVVLINSIKEQQAQIAKQQQQIDELRTEVRHLRNVTRTRRTRR